MTFEERLAELGVDLSDIEPIHSRIYDNDLVDAMDGYYADIIDRMETALENVLGERDYIIIKLKGECHLCKFRGNLSRPICRSCLDKAIQHDNIGNWELGELPPEDWSADDDI